MGVVPRFNTIRLGITKRVLKTGGNPDRSFSGLACCGGRIQVFIDQSSAFLPPEFNALILWYLWSGPRSPLFGKDRIATFERDFIADKTPHREHKNPYFTLINEVEFCDKVLDEFGVDPKRGLIVNGHVPVKIEKGESPLKHSGKAITIDGAFSEAYGDYGYTLVLEADRTYLALHHQFDSVEAAIRDGVDIIPSVTNVRVFDKPQRTADTGRGAELRTRIELLERLIEAYQNNELHQSSMDGSWPAASLP